MLWLWPCPLVRHRTSSLGYRKSSFFLASATRNVQTILACTRFRSATQAATSADSRSRLATRRFRHCRLSTLNSHSAMFSHDACFGVWWNSSRRAKRHASSGG